MQHSSRFSPHIGSTAGVRASISPFSNALILAAKTARAVVRTQAHLAPTIARIILGAVILPHGAQKLLGWFGGYGFTGTMQWFTETMHIPWLFGFAAIIAESVGGLALLVGFASRIAALGVGAVFVTAVATVHAPHGFFMNWFGNQKGEGWEYFLLGVGLVLVVAIYGGGAVSADRAISRRLSR